MNILASLPLIIYQATKEQEEDEYDDDGNVGVSLTLAINGTISIIALVLFFGLCHPTLKLYNVRAKYKLFLATIAMEKQRDNVSNNNNEEEEEDSLVMDIKNRMFAYFERVWKCLWHLTKTLLIPKYIATDNKNTCKTYGRDLATLFMYERNVVYASIICTIIACAVLFPLHFTGHLPSGQDMESDRDLKSVSHIVYSSIYMRINSPGVLFVHVALIVVFMWVFFYFMVIRFLCHPMVSKLNYAGCDEKPNVITDIDQNILVKMADTNQIRPLRSRLGMMGEFNNKQKQILSDIEAPPLPVEDIAIKPTQQVFLMSPYCVTIKKLPQDMDRRSFHHIIHTAASIIPENDIASKIAKTVLVPDLRERVSLDRKRSQLAEQLENVKARNLFREKVEKDKDERTTLCCKRDVITNEFHWRQKVDTEEYLTRQLQRVESDIKEWDAMYLEAYERMGYGVVPDDLERAKSSNFQIPSCSGFGFILFTTVDAADIFARSYRTGIALKKHSLTQEITTTTGNILEPPREFEYRIDRERHEQKYCPLSFTLGHKFKTWIEVSHTNYESQDIDWTALFEYNSLSLATPVIRRVITYVIIAILFCVCASPLLIVSGLQSIIQLQVIDISEKWFLRTTGNFGSFVFNYAPTLLLMIITEILPLFVIMLGLYSKRTTFSSMQRRVILRNYVFLVGSTVFLPSILMVSADGVIQYFSGTNDLRNGFQKLFIVSSGTFFITLLLQKALLKNSLHLFRLGSLFSYMYKIRFSQNFWLKVPILNKYYRYLTPKAKLKIVENDSVRVEKEYSFMNWILVVTFIYGLYSPYVWLCSLGFFLYKYYADRYIATFIYGHRKEYSLHGATIGMKSDYISHHEHCESQCALMIGNMFLLALFYTVFFAIKIPYDKLFIAHTVICSVLTVICFLGIFLLKSIAWKIRRVNIKRHNSQQQEQKEQQPIELSREYFSRAYEPSSCYHFPCFLSGKDQAPF
jgi:hypothetical protein